MKLRRKNKKGFTIVELVIVIAVIGVLAAVLIPVFVNLTNKANKASDESLVKNLNTALAMQEQEIGDTKNNTMHDAVEDLKTYGYLVENLVTKSDDKLLWNQETNRFILEDRDADEIAKYAKTSFWRIQNNADYTDGFSIYAGLGFNLTEVTVGVGFDVGDHDEIDEVNYVRAADLTNPEDKQTVTIRTSQGDLNVEAAADTVHHYSFLHGLDIVAIANASYHEHGTVLGGATISQGHIVLEEGSNVPSVDVVGATGGVTVTANESTVITVDDASASETTVVANTESVYVSGEVTIEGTNADDVVSAQLIMTWSQLKGLEDKKEAFAKLGANISDAQELFIDAGHTFKMDLNGFTLSTIESQAGRHYYAINSEGDVEIFDTSASQVGAIKARGIENIGGKMTIQSGNFYNVDANGGATVWNESKTANSDSHKYMLKSDVDYAKAHDQNYYDTDLGISIANGVYTVVETLPEKATYLNCDQNSAGTIFVPFYQVMDVTSVGEVVINGGNYYVEYVGSSSDSYGPGVISSQLLTKLTINGGRFETNSNRTYAIISNGELLINDAEVISHGHGALSVSAGNAVVNGGTFSAVNYYGIYVAGEFGTVTCEINGGTFTSEKQVAANIGNKNRNFDGGVGAKASVIINDGTFNGGTGQKAIKVAFSDDDFGVGKAFIYGGTFSTEIDDDYIMPGHSCSQNSDGAWIVE